MDIYKCRNCGEVIKSNKKIRECFKCRSKYLQIVNKKYEIVEIVNEFKEKSKKIIRKKRKNEKNLQINRKFYLYHWLNRHYPINNIEEFNKNWPKRLDIIGDHYDDYIEGKDIRE